MEGKTAGEDSSKKCKLLEGTIEIMLTFERLEDLTIVHSALIPEAKNPPTHRSRVIISVRDKSLKIEISSKDLISLRAALNSYLRWIYVIISGLKVIRSVNRSCENCSGKTATNFSS